MPGRKMARVEHAQSTFWGLGARPVLQTQPEVRLKYELPEGASEIAGTSLAILKLSRNRLGVSEADLWPAFLSRFNFGIAHTPSIRRSYGFEQIAC